MAVKVCERCGESFTSARSTAKYCRATCRKAAEKARARARAKQAREGQPSNVLQLVKPREKEKPGGSHTKAQAAVLAELALPSDVAGDVEYSTREKFDELGVDLSDPQPMVAITLARRIDRNMSETGAGLRSLVTSYNETMQLVVGARKVQDDPLDMLRAVRERIAAKASSA